MQAIPLMMDRRELIACAPTGSGKTAAYLVPLIHHLMSKKEKAGKKHIRSIILCPTRELAQQVLRECMALMPAGCLKVIRYTIFICHDIKQRHPIVLYHFESKPIFFFFKFQLA